MSISTRSLVESGNNSEIAGFVISGTQAEDRADPGQWPGVGFRTG